MCPCVAKSAQGGGKLIFGVEVCGVVCNPAHHRAGPKIGKRGGLVSGRASGHKRSAPNHQACHGMNVSSKTYSLKKTKDLKSLGVKKEWTLERTSWRSLIGGKRPTCA